MQARLTTKPVQEVITAIQALDLQSIKLRMMDPESGEGWSQEYASRIEAEYKLFLTMLVKHPADMEDILVSKDVDEFWHNHILHTQKYADDCQKLFGNFLHHNPQTVARSVADKQKRSEAAVKTRRLYGQIPGTMLHAGAYCNAAIEKAAYCNASVAYCNAAVHGEKGAYCNAAIRAPEAAYCNAMVENAAYCNATAEAGHAYCNATARNARTTYCNAAVRSGDAAYCNAAVEKAAYCNAGAAAYCNATVEKSAYCNASAAAYCNATVGQAAYCNAAVRPGEAAYCNATVGAAYCNAAAKPA